MRSKLSLMLAMTALAMGTTGCPSGTKTSLQSAGEGGVGVAGAGTGGVSGGNSDAGIAGEGGAGGIAGDASSGTGGEAGVGGSGGAGGVVPNEPMFTGRTSGEKVDLLFMVDNSNTMREEQAALRAQFPRLIQALLAGVDLDGDGVLEYEGARDVHLGVVSSDLGLPGVTPEIEACEGLGDNGALANMASPDVQGCSQQIYDPPFLSYVDGESDAEQIATDFACLATVGIDGCGFEQQLEAALKAVWPGGDDRISFVSDPSGFGVNGNSGGGFPNDGFIRNDPDDLSLIAIVLVTDEEDCSSKRMDHFVPAPPPGDPRELQGLNLRCYYESLNPDGNIFEVERYVRGFKELRPGNEQVVLFGAIVGVPPELVTPEKVAAVDYSDSAAVDAFYDGILADPMMQYAIDDKGTPEPFDDNLRVSCMTGADEDPTARAYPPRRIVEVAKGFGRNGFVQSICNDDFVPAIDLIITRIAETLDPIIE